MYVILFYIRRYTLSVGTMCPLAAMHELKGRHVPLQRGGGLPKAGALPRRWTTLPNTLGINMYIY